ncbi:C40 family peptidase [Streptomyces sp. NPDC048527]|uniref:C40 family peptidase n=1 Tax=Streptomyces sp. NPDC048527 TaxID=3365568 RepID=UPI003715B3CD
MMSFSVPRVAVSVAVVVATAASAVAAVPQIGDASSKPQARPGDTNVRKIRERVHADRVGLRRSLGAAAERAGLEAGRGLAERAAATEAVLTKRAVSAQKKALAEKNAAAKAGKRRVERKARASSRATVALREALTQRGKPYVWGATGPSAFDCSGLMQYAYRRAGLNLPRTTWGQIHAGRRVPVSAARPGDLVFFLGATHVGMYMGGGRVVHAPRPGRDVSVTSLHAMPVYAVVRPGRR